VSNLLILLPALLILEKIKDLSFALLGFSCHPGELYDELVGVFHMLFELYTINLFHMLTLF